MGTRNEGGYVSSVTHNSKEGYGNRWWLKSQYLMKEPRTLSKVGKVVQEGRWLEAFLAFIISNEESAHLEERDKVSSNQSSKVSFLKTLGKAFGLTQT